MKTTSWNSKDNDTAYTINRCYIDPNPFNPDGTLRNDYRLYSEYIDMKKKNGLNNHKEASDLTEAVKQTLYEDYLQAYRESNR